MTVSTWMRSFPVKQAGSTDKHPDTTIIAEDYSESGSSGEFESRQKVSAL